jgi:hypothetical protein
VPGCEVATDCGTSTACVTYFCQFNTCGSIPAGAGTACDDGVCDGLGVCVPA